MTVSFFNPTAPFFMSEKELIVEVPSTETAKSAPQSPQVHSSPFEPRIAKKIRYFHKKNKEFLKTKAEKEEKLKNEYSGGKSPEKIQPAKSSPDLRSVVDTSKPIPEYSYTEIKTLPKQTCTQLFNEKYWTTLGSYATQAPYFQDPLTHCFVCANFHGNKDAHKGRSKSPGFYPNKGCFARRIQEQIYQSSKLNQWYAINEQAKFEAENKRLSIFQHYQIFENEIMERRGVCLAIRQKCQKINNQTKYLSKDVDQSTEVLKLFQEKKEKAQKDKQEIEAQFVNAQNELNEKKEKLDQLIKIKAEQESNEENSSEQTKMYNGLLIKYHQLIDTQREHQSAYFTSLKFEQQSLEKKVEECKSQKQMIKEKMKKMKENNNVLRISVEKLEKEATDAENEYKAAKESLKPIPQYVSEDLNMILIAQSSIERKQQLLLNYH